MTLRAPLSCGSPRRLDVTLHPELRVFFLESGYFSQLGLHLPIAREGLLWIITLFTHPLAQHVLVNIQVFGRLTRGNAALSNQLDRFDLEFPAELPPCNHELPPVSFHTLTKCL
jgi:hypothetical protein